jgi:hypothetical protein
LEGLIRMRSRRLVWLAGALVLFATLQIPPVFASTSTAGVTQEDQGGQQEGEEGQGDADAETGAGEEETEGGATETGPPWTYQMAWISLAGLALLLLACGYLYWKLVVVRRRGET